MPCLISCPAAWLVYIPIWTIKDKAAPTGPLTYGIVYIPIWTIKDVLGGAT